MDSASHWRLELAKRISPYYTARAEVRSVLLIGSASRGWADAYSDVELGVFWREEPSEEARRCCAEQVGGTGWRPSPYDAQVRAWTEEYYVEGVKIDLGHWTASAMERILADVVDCADPSLPKQTSVSAVLHAAPLYGEDLMRMWQAKASAYPPALAEAMVREHLTFSPHWMLRMLAERDDFLLVRQNLCVLARRILLVLCGLNHQYYAGHKWVPHQIAALDMTPPDLTARLRRALEGRPTEAVEEMGRLIEETLDLVASNLPAVAVSPVRARFLDAAHFHLTAPGALRL